MSVSGQVIRPNNFAAIFTNPTSSTSGSFPYNAGDSIDLSWTTWAANSSAITLQFYYWTPSFGGSYSSTNNADVQNYGRAYGSPQVVAQNGSMLYVMPSPPITVSEYTGWWKLDFTRQDQSPPWGTTLSDLVNCTMDASKPVQTWNAAGAVSASSLTSSSTTSQASSISQAASSTSQAASSTPQAASSTPDPTVTVLAASAPTISPAAGTGANLSTEAVVGVVIGIIAGIGILAAIAAVLWLRWRKARSAPEIASEAGQNHSQISYVSQEPTIASMSELPVAPYLAELTGSTTSLELSGCDGAQELPLSLQKAPVEDSEMRRDEEFPLSLQIASREDSVMRKEQAKSGGNGSHEDTT